MPEIVVAIPTYRRPERLARLLRALAAIDWDRPLAVAVADNDPSAREGDAVCRKLVLSGYRWPLASVPAPERGIAQARNALARFAMADGEMRFVAMLDDDEWPERNWLRALMETQNKTGCEVVRGSVRREFEMPPPQWARDWEGIAPIDHPSGFSGPVEGIGNVLIARRAFEAIPAPWFDPAFGLTGGEDKDFLLRLKGAGMRFARAPEAIVHEHVPAHRLALSWSLARAYRTGNCDMRLALKHQGVAAGARESAKAVAALAAFPFLSLAFGFHPRRRLDGVRKLARAMGKLGALFGHRYHEYASPRG